METPTLIARLIARLEADPAVKSVTPVGSRAGGTPTALSDWDYFVDGAPAGLVEALPRVVASMAPLACFWDPLSRNAALMTIVPGPLKVDLITAAENPEPRTAHSVTRDGVDRIDAHFWDWALWLGAKRLAGEDDLVAAELRKMHRALLAAIGVERTPSTLADAVELYRHALRDRGLNGRVDGRLAAEVQRVLRDHGLVRPSRASRRDHCGRTVSVAP